MSNKAVSFLIYLLGLSPLVGYFCINVLDVSYTFFMIALFTFVALIQFIDPITIRNYSFPKYTIYFFLFTLYTVFSDVFLAGQSISLKYLYGNEIIGTLLVLFVTENYSNHKTKILKNVNLLINITIISALIVILIQEIFNETFFVFLERVKSELDGYNQMEARLPSIFSWTGILDIGLVFIPILSLALDNLFFNRKTTMPIFYFIGAIVVFLSKNRWIMINFIALLFMYLSYYSVSIKNFVKYFVGIILVIYVSLIILTWTNVPVKQIINNRILEKSEGGLGQGSAGSRIFAFKVFAELFPKHMILGKGMLHSFGGQSKDYELVSALQGRSSQIHVGYLSLFYYYGLIGGLLYITSLVLFMKKLYRDAKTTMHWGPFYGFLGLVLANFTLVSFAFFNAGLILCLFYNKVYLNNYLKLQQTNYVSA